MKRGRGRGGRGGRGGSVSSGSRGGRALPAPATLSLSAALREASAGRDSAAPATRPNAMAKRRAHAKSDPTGGARLRLQPAAPEMAFWRGLCRPALLAQALANVGARVEADPAVAFLSPRPRRPFAALTADRIAVARQALVDAAALLAGPPLGAADAVRHLASLADAAVPLRLPPLGTLSTVTPAALRDRMRRLCRLRDLRAAHDAVLPALRYCNSAADVASLLALDSMGPMLSSAGGGVSCEKEQRTIEALLAAAAAEGPAATAAGGSSGWAVAAGSNGNDWPLRVAAGVYVARRRERCAAMAALLSAAELFGLPPFLRSIRAARGAKPTGSTAPVGGGPAPPGLFPSLEDLDPSAFDAPAPGHAHVVQEELVDLACAHARFGAVVGEADQIVALLRDSASAVDPLRPIAQAVARGDGTAARWLCGNQWNPTSAYYALVFAAVAPPADALLVDDECSEDKEADAGTAYYVAAILELART